MSEQGILARALFVRLCSPPRGLAPKSSTAQGRPPSCLLGLCGHFLSSNQPRTDFGAKRMRTTLASYAFQAARSILSVWIGNSVMTQL